MKQDEIGPAKVHWDVNDEVVRSAYQRFEGREELYTTKAAG